MYKLQTWCFQIFMLYNGYILKLRYTILHMCIILPKLLNNCLLGKFQWLHILLLLSQWCTIELSYLSNWNRILWLASFHPAAPTGFYHCNVPFWVWLVQILQTGETMRCLFFYVGLFHFDNILHVRLCYFGWQDQIFCKGWIYYFRCPFIFW